MTCRGIFFLVLLVNVEAILELNISVVSDPINVWSAVDTLHKCGIIDVPDIPARAFRDNAGNTRMIEGSTHFHFMSGPSLFNQTRSCNSTWDMTGDPNPAMYAGDEFLDSAIVFANNVLTDVESEHAGIQTGVVADNHVGD